jgi:Flp pilus assembly protein TadB
MGSEKTQNYLNKKLQQCEKKLNKLKRKRKLIKILYIVTVLLSIITSAIVTVISTITIVPVIVITVLSVFSAILTAISARFNFHDKKAEIKSLIEKLNNIKSKLEYVISCNGDLTDDEHQQIMNDF